MRNWNVLVAVVDLVEAPTAEAAIEQLRSSLKAHGFDPYEGNPVKVPDVFESEDA